MRLSLFVVTLTLTALVFATTLLGEAIGDGSLEGPSSVQLRVPDSKRDTILVSTLDGRLYGLDPRTGAVRWNFASGKPLIRTFTTSRPVNEDDPEPELDLLPGLNGSIYLRRDDNLQIAVNVRDLVHGQPFRTNNLVLLGRKETHVFGLGLATGQLQFAFSSRVESGVSPFGEDQCVPDGISSGPDLLTISHTQYFVRAVDITTGVRWNISYSEFQPVPDVDMAELVVNPLLDWEAYADGGKLQLVNIDDRLLLIDRASQGILWQQALSGPVASVYAIDDKTALARPVPVTHPLEDTPPPAVALLPSARSDIQLRDYKSQKYVVFEPPVPTTIPALPDKPANESKTLPPLAVTSPPSPQQRSFIENQWFLLGVGLAAGAFGVAIGLSTRMFMDQSKSNPASSKPLLPSRSPPLGKKSTNKVHQTSGRFPPASTKASPPAPQVKKTPVNKKANKAPTVKEEQHSVFEFKEDVVMVEKPVASVVNGGSSGKESSGGRRPLTQLQNGNGVGPAGLDPSTVVRAGKLKIFTNEVLGHGSQGTVVFLGELEGRKVAVKRMLTEFYSSAHKEISVLIESDQHPNVVRYFAMEEDTQFIYLALELCPKTLSDYVEEEAQRLKKAGSIPAVAPGQRQMAHPPTETTRHMLMDLIDGIAFLHSKQIVHRDIKPVNVLISANNIIKISDMGLSKKLESHQMSYESLTPGTCGWQAPEVIRNGRLTKAVDIFSAGCLVYYVLTLSKHPYGDRFERELHILRGQFDISEVEHLPEAHHLIAMMIDPDANSRLSAEEAVRHPFFWSDERRLAFLVDVSDRVEPEDKDSAMLEAVENQAAEVLGNDWVYRLDPELIANLGKYRKYNAASLRDLLRVIRNKKHHFRDLPPSLQQQMGPVPSGYLNYFSSRFPMLLICVYDVIRKHCVTDPHFVHYFT